MKKILIIILTLGFFFFSNSVIIGFFRGNQETQADVSVLPETVKELPQQFDAPTKPDEEIASSPLQTKEDNYMHMYQPVLDSYRRFLAGEEVSMGDMTERGDYYLIIGNTGISYLCRYGGTLGYCLQDLNIDGIPEMLISASGSEYYDGYLYDLFTLIDGVPNRVLASSERVRYQLTNDNYIYFEGSAGAGLNICVLYSFNGDSLSFEEGVVMNNGLYFETETEHDNIFEMMESDRLITEEDYFIISESWRNKVSSFNILAF